MSSNAPVAELTSGMIEQVRQTQELIEKTDYEAVSRLVELLHDAYHTGKKVFIFGNGGSAACASHLAEDLAKGILDNLECTKRLRVIGLADSTPFITALGNDCGYETIFREQMATLADPGDIAIAISGSGNSPNVLRALEWAKENGLSTVGMTGFSGGKAKEICDFCIHYEMQDMEISENAHVVALHLIVSGLRGVLKREAAES